MTKEELALLVRKPINQLENVSGIPEGKIPFYTGDGVMKLMDISNLNNISKSAMPLAPIDPTPTVEGLYIPTESGTYANADGLVAQEGYYTLFFFDGVTWTKSENLLPQVDIQNKIIVDDTSDAVSGKAVADYIPKVSTQNIFDWTDVVDGFYIDGTDGSLPPNASFFVSNKIPVVAGDTYSKGANNIAFYTASDVFISYHNFNPPSTLLAPVNSAYMLVSSTIANKKNIVIVKGDVYPSEYISGQKKISNDILPDSAIYNLPASTDNGNNIFDKLTVEIDPNDTTKYKSKRIGLKGLAFYIKNKGILTVYDANSYGVTQYLANVTTPFILPEQIAYGILEGNVSDLDTTIFNQGKVLLQNQLAQMRSLRSLVKGCGDMSVVIVSKTNGDYSDIDSAIQYAYPKSTALNPITILIFPGDYYEHLSIPSRNLTLLGVNRETCRIIDESGDYNNAPINMAGSVIVENLTIIANNNQQVGTPANPSYAIHHDSDGEGESFVRNCNLISTVSNAIGIGTQDNQQLTIDNCKLITTAPNRGAILYHNATYPNMTNQKFVVKNTQMYCDNDDVVALIDSNFIDGANDNRDTKITFQNCIGYRTDGVLPSIEGTPSQIPGVKAFGYMRLKGDSFGNNIAELNF